MVGQEGPEHLTVSSRFPLATHPDRSMPGFFSSTQVTRQEDPLVPRCGICGLHRHCQSPRMPVYGEGRRGIMLIGEAPGEREDEEGVPLVGKSGKRMRSALAECGVDMDEDCWRTNAVICRPRNNATPSDEQVESCRPCLNKAISELQPKCLILLGGAAVKSVVGTLWREDVGSIGRWVGWQIPSQALNAWVCPVYHPAYLLRSNDPVLDLWFDRHVNSAVELRGRPWPEGVPDFVSQVEVLYDTAEAGKRLQKWAKAGGTVAFDYETDRLKPDRGESRIVSCAVCWEGRETIAFPWYGDAVAAVGELLRSPMPKWGANIKFEDRWTRQCFGHRVRGWQWDCMLASHVLDYRPNITSVKFQAFVLLGQPVWDATVAPYLKSEDHNTPNRIKQLPLGELLLYNGLDARLEYEICRIQRKQAGVE